MHILIATPLYPPDIAAPAPYTKELATRLTREHTVSILTYSHLPEEVPGVNIMEVNKREPRIKRLITYTRALIRAGKQVDVIIVENGASTEVPAFFASFVTNTPFIIHTGDPLVRKQTVRNPLRRMFASLIRMRARAVLTDVPDTRPEILPFEKEPQEAFTNYELSWTKHLALLKEIL